MVAESRNGQGVFATKIFQRGDVVFHVEGKILRWEKLLAIGGSVGDNAFRFGAETYLSPKGHVGDFLNHSCESNSGVKKIKRKLFIVAIEDIPKGTEILIDYSTILGNDDIWTMKCSCGSKKCRKIIKNFGSLPAELQEQYRSLGIVPAYIQ